jgi:hypothetical protein
VFSKNKLIIVSSLWVLLFSNSSLVQAERIEFPKKEVKIYGQEYPGGDYYEKASALPLEMEFRLSHHQDKGYYDYFFVDLEPGDLLGVRIRTGQKGLNRGKENNNCHGSIALHNSEKIELARASNIYGCNKSRALTYNARKAERVYLLIGHPKKQLHKNHLFYKAKLVSLNDGSSTTDAGETYESAISIYPGGTTKGFLSFRDSVDWYRFSGQEGQRMRLRLSSQNEHRSHLTALVKSDIGQVITSVSLGGSGSADSDEFRLPIDGDYIVQITTSAPSNKHFLLNILQRLKRNQIVAYDFSLDQLDPNDTWDVTTLSQENDKSPHMPTESLENAPPPVFETLEEHRVPTRGRGETL